MYETFLKLMIDVGGDKPSRGDPTPGQVVLGCLRNAAEFEPERQANKQRSSLVFASVLASTCCLACFSEEL